MGELTATEELRQRDPAAYELVQRTASQMAALSTWMLYHFDAADDEIVRDLMANLNEVDPRLGSLLEAIWREQQERRRRGEPEPPLEIDH